MGLRMESVQFQELVKILGFRRPGLNYSDFIEAFQDLKPTGMGKQLERAGNHYVGKTSLKYMTAQECYDQLQEQMRQGYASVRQAFYKIDDNHDGILNMDKFRRLLDSFMFIITDETFAELLKMFGLTKKSVLTYNEFCRRFEVIDSSEGHPWLNSCHRFNETKTSAEMAAEQVHECLFMKAQQTYQDMAKAFQHFDTDGSGIIRKKHLRSVLYKFILPISEAEFNKLWAMYDTDNKGFISHQDFAKRMGMGGSFAPGDNTGLQGTSNGLHDENDDNLLAHHQYQQALHDELTLNQVEYSKLLTAKQVEQELKDRFREYFADFDRGFKQLDRNRDGYITLNDLKRQLYQLNYFLDEQQFLQLLERLDVPVINNNKLSYFDFLHSIDDGRASKYNNRKNEGEPEIWLSFDDLTPEKAAVKLKERVTQCYDSLLAAFKAFDRQQTGMIKLLDFRRTLDNFCFRLSDKQFRIGVLTKCRISEPGSCFPTKAVNWILFLQDFSLKTDPTLREWKDYVGKVAPLPLSNGELTLNEIEDRISEVAVARKQTLQQAFTEIDYAKILVVSKDDFREILNQNVMRLNDDQFNRLWAKQSVNDFSNLDYNEFMRRYSSADYVKTINDDIITIAPEEIRPSTALTPPCDEQSPRSPSRLSSGDGGDSPLLLEKLTDDDLKNVVYKNWQEIQKECKRLDPNSTGIITSDKFVGILDKFGLMLSLEDARELMTKYDIGGNAGKFSYGEFLRHFILTLKPQDEGLLKRRKIHAARLPVNTGKENDSFVETMVAIRERILHCWKQMRRSFRNQDPQADGFVTPTTFRQILRQFSINLSEEDFYHLMSFYDHQMKGKVPYNDFIRAFLQ